MRYTHSHLVLTTATPYWPGRRRSQHASCSVCAARVVSNTRKFNGGYCTTNSTDWMSLTEYNSSSPCWCTNAFMKLLRCTGWQVVLTADVAGRQHLRSTSQRKMIVLRYRMDSYGRQCFSVPGPLTWNSLPDSLC